MWTRRLFLEFPLFLLCRQRLTGHCRPSAHTPGQVTPPSRAGGQEEAAAVSSAGSYRRTSETCMTNAGGPGTSSATGCWRSCPVASLCPVRDTDRDVQFQPLLAAVGGQQVCTTLEDVVSMFCHLLRGSATTSQSGQAAWRSLARVDFPTAEVWQVVKQEGPPLGTNIFILFWNTVLTNVSFYRDSLYPGCPIFTWTRVKVWTR